MTDIYKEILDQIDTNTLVLARLPDTIIAINEALADDNQGMSDIAKVIQRDVSLSSRIIQVVNSPLLRSVKPISSVFDAINRLGIAFIKNLAICVSVRDKFTPKDGQYGKLMRKIFDESEDLSYHGYMVTKYLTSSKLIPETSLLAGLVSHLGHLVILRFIADHPDYKELSLEEIDYLMTNFGETITQKILERWNFPRTILSALSIDVSADTVQPTTYRDVFVLTHEYLDFQNGEGSFSPIYEQIDSIIEENKVEFTDLKSTFN